ncbi:hypothetical protein [Siminovitchia sp. 179-K 8D1 HS]|uniref:hypothetical protein n=1 Tax=Siminovitchia sp. 179-K 8D1 HS TaxID=3142385 RepID=UPI0039A0D49C
MLHEATTKNHGDSCSCFTDSLRSNHTCDLCFLSEITEDFYCQVHGHTSHNYEELNADESSSSEKERHHDCHGCACELLQNLPENTPVEISTSKEKNVFLYYKSINTKGCKVSFQEPENRDSITVDCRDIFSIRYNKP